MRTNISKRMARGVIVTEEELRGLLELVGLENYKTLGLSAHCIDDTRLEFDTREELLRFENPTQRRIQSIEIDARDSYEEKLSIAISDTDRPGVSFTIASESDDRARRLKASLEERFTALRPPWHWISAIDFLRVLLVTGSVAIVAMLLMLVYFGRAEISLGSGISVGGMLCGIGMFAGALACETFKAWLFPHTFIALGRQARELEARKAWQSRIVGTAVGTLGFGIVASLIASIVYGRWWR